METQPLDPDGWEPPRVCAPPEADQAPLDEVDLGVRTEMRACVCVCVSRCVYRISVVLICVTSI